MHTLHAPFAPPRGPDGDEPVFVEAWHAQVLAVASAAAEAGLFSRTRWSETLGAKLRKHQDPAASKDDDCGYYEAALAALEQLITECGGVSADALSTRTEAWRTAYLSTPHGAPVELTPLELPGDCGPDRAG